MIALLARGARAARSRARVVGLLYLVQVGVGVLFALAVWRTLSRTYDTHPLFARGVAGDDTALLLAMLPQLPALRALMWAGAALLLGWAFASWFLTAGLVGALAGRPFAATAAERGAAFIRLGIWSLIPYAAAALIVTVGVRLSGLELEDAVSSQRALGLILAGAAPGLLLLAVTACAADHGRAELVLVGGGAARALYRGFATALRRRGALGCYLLYVAVSLTVAAGYVAVTMGHPFAGLAGALGLLALRQGLAVTRHVLRCVLSGAQVALQLDVVELREIAERAKTRHDLGEGQPPQPLEGKVLDAE